MVNIEEKYKLVRNKCGFSILFGCICGRNTKFCAKLIREMLRNTKFLVKLITEMLKLLFFVWVVGGGVGNCS